MASRRRGGRRPPPIHRAPAPQRPPPSAGRPPRPPAVDGPRSLLPTILWGTGALNVVGLLVSLIVLQITREHSPWSRWTFIGTVLLLAVITLGAVAKALQTYLDWKDPAGKEAARR